MSRERTPEEVREEFIDYLRAMVRYWATLPRDAIRDSSPGQSDVYGRLDGLVFSILNVFDGSTAALPAFDIVCRPHPEDKAFMIANEEDWYPDGAVINDCHLHEMWCRKVK